MPETKAEASATKLNAARGIIIKAQASASGQHSWTLHTYLSGSSQHRKHRIPCA